MNGEAKRLGCVRIVPGRIWTQGKAAQDREWAILRKSWADHTANYRLTKEPVESTEYDEQRGIVRLEIRATGWLL